MNRLLRATQEVVSSDRTIIGGTMGGTAGLLGSQLADAVLQHYAEDPEAKPGLMRRGLTVGAPLLGALAGAMLANRNLPVYQPLGLKVVPTSN